MVVGPRTAIESPGSSELNEEEDSPEPDVDYMDEYDSEEERKQKRKKRPPPKIRGNAVTTTLPTTASVSRSGGTAKGGDNDKPFLCTGE